MIIEGISDEVIKICTDFNFIGWVEKDKYPELIRDINLYDKVSEVLSMMGMEIVNSPFCNWLVVRLIRENDSYSEYHRYHKYINSRHLALLLILYTKLILPHRIGQCSDDTELKVTFAEIFQMFGDKFKSGTRKVVSENNVKGLFTYLCKLNYIIKPHNKNYYLAGPLLYTISDELISDLADESFKVLFDPESEEIND